MSFINKINAGTSILAAKLFNKRTPIAVSWAVTGRCNFRCKYCDIWKNEFNELSTDEALRLIEEMKLAGTKRLSLTGGEPLLRVDISQIIQSAKKNHISTTMNSNGYLVNKKIDDIMDLDYLSISLDGSESIHETHRGKGTYSKSVESIRIAKERGISTGILAVITRHNVDRLDEVLNISKELDVGVLFQPVEIYEHSNKNINDLEPDQKKLKIALKKLIGIKNVINSKDCLMHFINPAHMDYKNCAAGRIFCRIDPDGSMYPCGRTTIRNTPPDARCGFMKGFKELESPRCSRCYCTGNVESNLLLEMRISSIMNQLNGV